MRTKSKESTNFPPLILEPQNPKNSKVKTVENIDAKPLPREGFIRLPQVLNVLGMSKTSFMDGVRAGRFPAQVKLGPRMSAWRVEDIRELIARLSEGMK